jgi:hypothetical protein
MQPGKTPNWILCWHKENNNLFLPCPPGGWQGGILAISCPGSPPSRPYSRRRQMKPLGEVRVAGGGGPFLPLSWRIWHRLRWLATAALRATGMVALWPRRLLVRTQMGRQWRGSTGAASGKYCGGSAQQGIGDLRWLVPMWQEDGMTSWSRPNLALVFVHGVSPPRVVSLLGVLQTTGASKGCFADNRTVPMNKIVCMFARIRGVLSAR